MKKTLFSLALLTTVFNSYSQEEKEYSKMAIKFAPTQLIFGELNFAFEHRIAPHSSLELSAGPTISELGGAQIITSSNGNFGGGGGQRQSDIGYFVSLGYRFYPLSYAEAPRGLYVSPELKYRVYNIIYKDNNVNPLSDKVGSTTQAMFRFNIGYQFWPGKTFAIDVFSGIGIGKVNHEELYYAVNYNADGTTTPYWLSQSSNRAAVNATLGVKIGIGK